MKKAVHALRTFRLRPFILLLFIFLASMLHVMPAQAQQKQSIPAPPKIASTAPAKKPAPAAKKELTPSSKVVKIAIIDHVRLRQEFKRLRASSTTLSENYTAFGKQSREEGKKIHQQRVVQLQEFEKEILQAINKTLAEGGFTELQSYRKDYANLRAVNITDLVLKKLN